MRKVLIGLVLTFAVGAAFAVASKNEKADPNKKAELQKRNYTEEEFKKAVEEEAAKMMKKAGSGHLVDFSKELLEKEDAIKNKELLLQKQEEELKNSKMDFQKKIAEFEESQKKFLGCIEGQKEAMDKRVSQMVEVISGMKPQSAADVLAIQDPELSVRILAMLEAQKASKIFNLMDKEISAKLQKQFLQMKK